MRYQSFPRCMQRRSPAWHCLNERTFAGTSRRIGGSAIRSASRRLNTQSSIAAANMANSVWVAVRSIAAEIPSHDPTSRSSAIQSHKAATPQAVGRATQVHCWAYQSSPVAALFMLHPCSHRCARPARPNQSLKPSPNGGPPGPGCGVPHSPQPGPGVPPSVPA
jgi:hypothetical protein